MKNISNDNIAFLETLLNTQGVSGYEYQTGCIIKEYMKKFATVETDLMGNVIGIINPENPFKIMISAHYDEIGFQIVHISDDGFLYFRRNGGIDKLSVPGCKVTISGSKGKIIGVIGKKPPHIQTLEERNKAIELEDLWIDIGVSSKSQAEKLVSIGDTASFCANYTRLQENNIISKGLDDKIGVFIILEALRIINKRKINVGLYTIASTQEEIGTRGISVCGYNYKPNAAICVDVGISTDVPDIKETKLGNFKLGAGVGLCHSADNNINLVKILQKTSLDYGIKTQNTTSFLTTGGTDTAKLQVTKGGVATALLSIPNRYMHSPVEMCNLNDVDDAISLIVETICSLTGDENFKPLE